jgi:hypothetical protein
MAVATDAFDAILPPAITSVAIRSGNEWLIPLPQAKEAIELATKHRIAVLGLEVFRADGVDGLNTEGYSDYEFKLGNDWIQFVSLNNAAALQYVVEHEFGSGYAYILTTTSAKEFEALKTTNG